MKQISGGVSAPQQAFRPPVSTAASGRIKQSATRLIYSSVPASAAAVYTTNLVKGAPLVVTKQHLADGKAQAIICNSGNANTCNANGIEIAEQMSSLLGQALHIDPSDVVVASTGVIGQPLDIAPIAAGIPELVKCRLKGTALRRGCRGHHDHRYKHAKRSPSASLQAERYARSAASAKVPA